MLKVSVIIPTYNPNINRLNQTLNGLKSQTLPLKEWELIIIDNNSNTSFREYLDLNWHSYAKVIKESKQGLTYARLKGFKESNAEFIIMVDDDNILARNYLSKVVEIFTENKAIAAIGGKSEPLFEGLPPIWIKKYYNCLALRDLGEIAIIEKWEHKYPHAAPIGAGMAIRKAALSNYILKIESGLSIFTDRIGTSLSSGGDNDIVLEIIKMGWKVAYYPTLFLQHIIPQSRTNVKYLGRLNKDSTKSWIHLLNSHGINPWPKIPKWSLQLRRLKAKLIFKPWKSEPNFIDYNGVCGMYEALSEI